MNCGLLGRKLSHSYSPQIHACFAQYSYSLFEKEPDQLADFLNNGAFTGLNVTIPYKKDVLPYCAELSECARKLGAVNTIVRKADGLLIGHNTDYFGFSSMLTRSGLQVSGKKALVLGSGGASATAVAVLQEAGADVIVISRSGKNNYSNLHLHKDAAVLVNATPVGMYPDVDQSPVDLKNFPQLEGVLDLIYNPARTKLLLDAEARGIVAENGLWMLVAQAKESAEWFTGETIHDAVIPQIHRKLRLMMENTVLIGMPGCGKSTVGKLLAQRLGKSFVDADTSIAQKAGMPIPEIFSRYGEAEFRRIETSTLQEIAASSGQVIATGGGCVTIPENYPVLHQNGIIIWLQRSLDVLPTDGRPLSQSSRLSDMYQIREPLYNAFSDMHADNNSGPENTVENILAALNWEESL